MCKFTFVSHYFAFFQNKMDVLTTVCERGVGGRNFDDIIIEFLADYFQTTTTTGVDVRNNVKAMFKLQVAAEKAKKDLSAPGVNEVDISVESLADGIHLNALLTREEFEKLAAGLVGLLRAPVEKALKEVDISASQLSEVEIVGGTSRVNIVKRTLGEILQLDLTALNYGLKTTLNADSACAEGAAWQCTLVSPGQSTDVCKIVNRLPHGIVAITDGEESRQVYIRNEEVSDHAKRLIFNNKTANFTITLSYDDAAVAILPQGESRLLRKFTIKISDTTAKIPDTVKIPTHTVEIPTCIIPTASVGSVIVSLSFDSCGIVGDPTAKRIVSKGKKFKYEALEVDMVDALGLTLDEVNTARELEASMTLEDSLTTDKRNELVQYICDTLCSIEPTGIWASYGSDREKNELAALLNDANLWLQGDGLYSSKEVYSRELDKLRLGNVFDKRSYVIVQLQTQLDHCLVAAADLGVKYAHVLPENREHVRKMVTTTRVWMDKRKQDLTSNNIGVQNQAYKSLESKIYTVRKFLSDVFEKKLSYDTEVVNFDPISLFKKGVNLRNKIRMPNMIDSTQSASKSAAYLAAINDPLDILSVMLSSDNGNVCVALTVVDKKTLYIAANAKDVKTYKQLTAALDADVKVFVGLFEPDVNSRNEQLNYSSSKKFIESLVPVEKHTTLFDSIRQYFSDLATRAHSPAPTQALNDDFSIASLLALLSSWKHITNEKMFKLSYIVFCLEFAVSTALRGGYTKQLNKLKNTFYTPVMQYTMSGYLAGMESKAISAQTHQQYEQALVKAWDKFDKSAFPELVKLYKHAEKLKSIVNDLEKVVYIGGSAPSPKVLHCEIKLFFHLRAKKITTLSLIHI